MSDLSAVESIFHDALKLSPDARAAYLDEACADSDARQHVERLLVVHSMVGSFLNAPAAATLTTDEENIGEGPGTIIGPYKLMEQIGEGGFGLVFVAEQQQPVRRKVALKVIKPGMDTRQVVARFEAERQALALMDHPNIAKVFDAGATETGRPYFVMELVKGMPITEYCDAERLSAKQRLALFVQVCQAVQHAHQKGVIHRDLKPSNILVAPHDGIPVVKVIDFGVAKALGQQLSDKTIYTRYAQMIGTPLYMSPEQAEVNQLDVDTRSDIYSLGVLLYELLTGTTPFDKQRFHQAAFDEIRRIIKEEEPPRPSTRVSTLRSAERAKTGDRKAKVATVVPNFHELDWIVMRCLEKDRTRRYDTATGLAKDVQRYLNNEPVEACPPSWAYRLRKFGRRNLAPIAVGTLMGVTSLVCLFGGLTIGLIQATGERDRARVAEAAARHQQTRAEEAEKRAKDEAAAARAVGDFLQNDLLRQANPMHQAELSRLAGGVQETLPNPSVLEVLDRAAEQLTPERIEQKFPGMPFVQAEILGAVGDAYYGIMQDKKAEHFLGRAHELFLKTHGPDDPRTLDCGRNLAMAMMAARRSPTEIERRLEAVLAGETLVFGATDERTMKTRVHLALVVFRRDRREAFARLKAVREELAALVGPTHLRTVYATYFIGVLHYQEGRFDDAIREMKTAGDAVRRGDIRSDHPDVETAIHMLYRVYREAKRAEEGIALLEDALARREAENARPNLGVWMWRHALGWAYADRKRTDDAIRVFEQNLKAAPAPNDETTMEALAQGYRIVKRFDESQSLLQRALDLKRLRHGPAVANWDTGRLKWLLASGLLRAGKPAEAEPQLREGIAEMQAHIAHRPPWDTGSLAKACGELAKLCESQGKAEEAAQWQAERAKHAKPAPKADGG